MNPYFCISIDFELFWGVRDKLSLHSYRDNILGGRESIPLILNLFKKYGISATWAIAGISSFSDKKSLIRNYPSSLPEYHNENLCPYRYIAQSSIGDNESEDPYHFGYSLVDQISQVDGMELASHSFSHFYALEPRVNFNAYHDDLTASISTLSRFGKSISSAVFCRNQYDLEHIDVLKKCGFIQYRGNELHNLNSITHDDPHDLKRRVLRNIDSYMNLTGFNLSIANIDCSGMLNIPSSAFLRPYISPFTDYLKINRIMSSMEHAAIQGYGYHLWWHPENFGKNIDRNINSLELILKFYCALNQKYGMKSLSMSEVGKNLIKEVKF